LAIVYLVAQHHASVLTLTVNQVCMGIFSLSALAFIAGGMNVIYQIERLPLMAAISIHSCVLYLSYLVTYLLNDWLAWGVTPILVFSGIFLVGFVGIWAIIYSCIKRNTDQVNEILKKKLHNAENINE
jgi:branched-subunit amino acid ABC-type transport system permease component